MREVAARQINNCARRAAVANIVRSESGAAACHLARAAIKHKSAAEIARNRQAMARRLFMWLDDGETVKRLID